MTLVAAPDTEHALCYYNEFYYLMKYSHDIEKCYIYMREEYILYTHPPSATGRMWHKVNYFKWNKASLDSEFFFSYTNGQTKVKEPQSALLFTPNWRENISSDDNSYSMHLQNTYIPPQEQVAPQAKFLSEVWQV